MPTFVKVNNYGFECVVVGIVAFAQSVSLAVLMAKKHHYDIDANKVCFAIKPGITSAILVLVRYYWH